MNNYLINQTEHIFLLLDNDLISDKGIQYIMNNMMNNNNGQYEYLLWLLNRWVVLRKHRYHLPGKVIYTRI